MNRLTVVVTGMLVFLAFFSSEVVAQIPTERKYDPAGTVLSQVEAVARAKYGNDHEVSYHIMDSLIAHSRSGKITDPYGTLKGYVLFSAWKTSQEKDSVVTGMFKSGQIIWDDYPGTKAGFGGALLTTQDINNDGEVDILQGEPDFELMTREGSGISYLWILSWDGTRGRMINNVDPATGQSTIVSIDEMYELIDADRDGVLEIRGDIADVWQEYFPNHNPPTLPKITYGWNGSEYGFSPTVRQVPESEFLPANDLDVSVRCSVLKSGTSYVYEYAWTNRSTSKQGIQNIYVGGLEDTSSNHAPPEWEASSSSYLGGRYFCSAHIDFNYTIRPGYSVQGFQTTSAARPTIVRYYVQGLRTSTPIVSDDEHRNDILTNSASGYTLGTSDTTQSFVPLDFIDTLWSYASQSRSFGWITTQATADKYLGYFATAKSQLQSGNTEGTRATLQTVLQDVDVDSTSNLSSEAYALLRYNTEYLLSHPPTAPPPGLAVKLVNSAGTNLTGGSLQYYEGSWKDAVNNSDGTFTVMTSLHTVSLRMTYAYGSQTKSNVTVGTDTVLFQTVSAQIQLQNSGGSLMDQGTVQCYAGAWRELGATSNGVATKELLPGSYSFRMTYAFAGNDKQQDIGSNPIVVFQTVNAAVQLQNSQGSLIDQGVVQYYAGAWKDFGLTTNGVVTKELLPNNYSFRMTYAFASNDKQQNIGTNPTVLFRTVNATVELRNSQGDGLDQGTVQYYSGAWREFGATSNGVVTKELLPNNYTFRTTYAFASNDKQQNIGTNPTVIFQTVNASVQLQNSQGAPIDQGTAQYYSGAWRNFGVTSNGVVSKELLPNSYSFRMTYAFASNDKQQNIGMSPTVVFQTVSASVQLQNSQGVLMDQGTVQYYSGAWRSWGSTAGGAVTKELLPGNYTFRMTYEFVANEKAQDISANPIVGFSTIMCTARVRNSQNQPVDGAQASYYSGAWRLIGPTVNGEITKEMLPANLTFRISHGGAQQDKVQNLATNSIVEFVVQ